MKKLLFSAVNLDVGGIETALLMLLNSLVNKYEITLVLEKKEGIFLNDLSDKIEVIEYSPSKNKFTPLRKVFNFFKQKKFKNKYKNKFDFSCSFATYSRSGSFVARTASKNSVLWCHLDYLSQYKGDKEKVKEFFESVKFKEFKKLIFVSKKSKETFCEVFPDMEGKVEHINNMIDDKKILQMAEEPAGENFNLPGETVFVNVSRHYEEQKRISRIIEAATILKKENVSFKIILVGDGNDTSKYKKLVEDNGLRSNVIFVGNKKNPYPFIKMSDCVILTSDYEGSPVTFVEAFVLNKPIITTDVSGSEQIEGKYGIVVEKDIKSIAKAMQLFIEKGYTITKKFNATEYNNEIIEKLEQLF